MMTLRKVKQLDLLDSFKVVIENHFGSFEVDWISDDYWVHCPKANGGFGQSFCCHADREVKVFEK